MILKIVMCEGPHDTAFISRILRVMGCGNDKTQIGDFPEALREFLLSQYKPDIEAYPVYDARSKTITPNYGLNYKDEILFLLYNMGGDSKKFNRQDLIRPFIALFGTEMASSKSLGFDLHFIYEFDADQEGREKRIEKVNQEIKEVMPDFPGLAHVEYEIHRNITWGAFIFAAPGSDKGKLEDMVLPLMREDNEDIFSNVEQLADMRGTCHLYNIMKSKMEKEHWDRDKAMIGMAGQLHKCGSGNVAIIEQSCFITKEQLLNSKECREIGEFLLAR